MRNKSINVFVFLFSLLSFLSVQAEEKIVYVDLNFVYNNSSAGKKINDQINKESKN